MVIKTKLFSLFINLIEMGRKPKTVSSESITINGVEYVPVGSVAATAAQELNGLRYVIVRSRDAGVFAGYLKRRTKDEVELLQARRLWYWDGAFTLSQLSQEGVTKPQNCKFPMEMPEHTVIGACEVIPCSEKARLSIKNVTEWKA